MEFDHVQPSLMHDFFQIQSIGIILLEQFQKCSLNDCFQEMPK